MSFSPNGPNADEISAFINAVYESIICAVLFSLVSARIASLLLVASAAHALMILHRTHFFGHNQIIAKSLMWEVALRSGLAAAILSLLPVLGPVGRWMKAATVIELV